jgi:anti-sigma regulatory factor (Ser/Thr protein kinase)
VDGTVGNHCGTPAGPTVSRPTCRHAGAAVSTTSQLVDVAVPYLQEGLRAGDLTLISCSPGLGELLRRELGTSASALGHLDLGLLTSRAPDVFTRVRRSTELAAERRHGSGRVRLLSEPTAPTGPEGWREEMRADAVFNTVMADLPITALCLFDGRRLPSDVVAGIGRVHPELATAGGWSASADYTAALDFVRALSRPRNPVEDGEPVFVVDDVPTLPDLRHRLGAALEALGIDGELHGDLHLALSEVAANAFRHGRRPVSARIWADPTRIVCTISDGGRSFDDPLAGFVPAHGYDLSRGGMGLWLARKLWDHVDLSVRPEGFTVRLSTALPGPDTA